MQKGSFRIDKPFRIDNAAGNAALNFYDVLQPAAARMPHASTHRYVRYQFDKSLPSAEAYRLQVSADSILITAKGHEGFMRAAQTLNQLVTRRGITCCTVTDSPAFAWRGVMIDVSRHFFSIDFLKKQIDALARYKINRLHLHRPMLPDGEWKSNAIRFLPRWQPGAQIRYGKPGEQRPTTLCC